MNTITRFIFRLKLREISSYITFLALLQPSTYHNMLSTPFLLIVLLLLLLLVVVCCYRSPRTLSPGAKITIHFFLYHLSTILHWHDDDKKKGMLLKLEYFGGLLKLSNMFSDDLWWNMADDDSKPEILVSQLQPQQRRIEVEPNNNPMVLKAEQIFREALKK